MQNTECVDSSTVECPIIQSEDGGSNPTSTLHATKAHQRKIREKLAEVEPAFEADIDTAIVREISRAQAKEIIVKYEWLGTMPAYIIKCYGIFFGEHCGGVVVYSSEYAENLGVWDKYGWTGKIICLSRGACVHWAHPHSASKLIRISMRMLPKRYKVVTCTVDETAGEVGTIYQACGFDYCGVLSKGGNIASIVTEDGSRMSSRAAKLKYGTRSIEKLRQMGLTVQSVPRKGRYFGFTGSKKERNENRQKISHLIKAYPKRQLSD